MSEQTKKLQSIARILCDCLGRIIDDSEGGQPNADYWNGQFRLINREIAKLKEEIKKETQRQHAIETQGEFQTLWGTIRDEMPITD